jgi:hypothetical protein
MIINKGRTQSLFWLAVETHLEKTTGHINQYYSNDVLLMSNIKYKLHLKNIYLNNFYSEKIKEE